MRLPIKPIAFNTLLAVTMMSLAGCDQHPKAPKILTPFELGVNFGIAQTEERFRNSELTLQLERDRIHRADMKSEISKLEECEAYFPFCPESWIATGIAAKKAGFTSGGQTIIGPVLALKLFLITGFLLSIVGAGLLLVIFILGPASNVIKVIDGRYRKRAYELQVEHDAAIAVLNENQKILYKETASIDRKLAEKEALLSNFERIKQKELRDLKNAISTASTQLTPLQSKIKTETKTLDELQIQAAKAKARLDTFISTQALAQNLRDPDVKSALLKIAASVSADHPTPDHQLDKGRPMDPASFSTHPLI